MASPDILTPEQAAEYLQVNRETIYRYVKEGKLVASKLGRSYRIPRQHIDLLQFATRTRPNIPCASIPTKNSHGSSKQTSWTWKRRRL